MGPHHRLSDVRRRKSALLCILHGPTHRYLGLGGVHGQCSRLIVQGRTRVSHGLVPCIPIDWRTPQRCKGRRRAEGSRHDVVPLFRRPSPHKQAYQQSDACSAVVRLCTASTNVVGYHPPEDHRFVAVQYNTSTIMCPTRRVGTIFVHRRPRTSNQTLIPR